MDENSIDSKDWSLSQAAEYLCPGEWAATRNNKDIRQAVWESLLSAIEKHGHSVLGIMSEDSDEPTPITPEQMRQISEPNFEDSEGENKITGLRISALRILPVLHSETAARRLDGLTLKKAFKRYVLKDAEVIALGKAAIASEPESERLFLEGLCSLEHGECWPVLYEELDLAVDAVAKSTISNDERSPRVPPNEVVQAAAVMTNRYTALIDLLRNGDIQADGLPEGGNKKSSVDEGVWEDESVWIDFESNHLTRDGNAKKDRIWSYIKLHNPANSFTKTPITLTEPQKLKKGPKSKINQEIGFRIADFLVQKANSPDGLSETQENLINDVIDYCQDREDVKISRTTVQKFLYEKLPKTMKTLRR